VSLTARVLAAIRRHRLIEPGEKVLVAVSGGPDSLALLHVLHELRSPLEITLAVAHLEHGLRGEESAEDARMVERTAAALGLPFVMERVRLAEQAAAGHVSLETAGRQARYAFFERAARELGCARVATGHTADDRVETLLLNLLRGAGLDGLRGIPRARPLGDGTVQVVRPLLDVRRADIEAYCEDAGLAPREDATNRSPEFARNRMRHTVLPVLEREAHLGLRERLLGLAELITEEVALLDEVAAELLARATRDASPIQLTLAAAPLAAAPAAVARRALRLAARRLGATGDLNRAATEALLRLAAGDLATGITLPGGQVRAVRRGDALVLISGARQPAAIRDDPPIPDRVIATANQGSAALERQNTPARDGRSSAALPPPAVPPPCPQAVRGTSATLPVPGSARALGYDFGTTLVPVPAAPEGDPCCCVLMDADKLSGPLSVRAPLPGDRVRPLGMRGRRKLQDLFVDAKLPRERRASVPVVVDAENIVWVVGFCLSDDVRLDAGTRRAVRVEARPGEPV
jgi:tRNA(Ile)-lysidine synthase